MPFSWLRQFHSNCLQNIGFACWSHSVVFQLPGSSLVRIPEVVKWNEMWIPAGGYRCLPFNLGFTQSAWHQENHCILCYQHAPFSPHIISGNKRAQTCIDMRTHVHRAVSQTAAHIKCFIWINFMFVVYILYVQFVSMSFILILDHNTALYTFSDKLSISTVGDIRGNS